MILRPGKQLAYHNRHTLLGIFLVFGPLLWQYMSKLYQQRYRILLKYLIYLAIRIYTKGTFFIPMSLCWLLYQKRKWCLEISVKMPANIYYRNFTISKMKHVSTIESDNNAFYYVAKNIIIMTIRSNKASSRCKQALKELDRLYMFINNIKFVLLPINVIYVRNGHHSNNK